jgi:hypothetical protein
MFIKNSSPEDARQHNILLPIDIELSSSHTAGPIHVRVFSHRLPVAGPLALVSSGLSLNVTIAFCASGDMTLYAYSHT